MAWRWTETDAFERVALGACVVGSLGALSRWSTGQSSPLARREFHDASVHGASALGWPMVALFAAAALVILLVRRPILRAVLAGLPLAATAAFATVLLPSGGDLGFRIYLVESLEIGLPLVIASAIAALGGVAIGAWRALRR